MWGTDMKNILKLQAYALLPLCGLLVATPTHALIQRNFVNLGFEDVSISTTTTGCRVYASQGPSVPGWLTTHPVYSGGNRTSCSGTVSSAIDVKTSSPIIEVWKGPRSDGAGHSVSGANDTNQFVELNADKASSIYQNVCLIQGEQFDWEFYHRGRHGIDKMKFSIGGTATAGSVVTDGIDVQVGETGNTGWKKYSGTFIVPSTLQSKDHFIGFTAVSGASTNIAEANFLDEIKVTLKPVVEFSAGDFQAKESDGVNAPKIKVIVVGALSVALPLVFTIDPSSSAKIGVDYKINGAALNTFTVTIPAGDHGKGYTAEIPVEVINNNLVQGDVFFKLNMKEDPSKFNLLSSNQCGKPGNSLATYTITDDDVGVKLEKVWKNAILNDKATLQSKGGVTGAPNANFLITADAANKTEQSPVFIMAENDTRTLHEILNSQNTGKYSASEWACTGGGSLNGNVLKTSATDLGKMITCSISNQRYEFFKGILINDNSGSTKDIAKAYNAVQDAGELGIAGSLIELKDCSGSPVIATATTNASGEFEILTREDIYAGRNEVCLVQNDLSGYSSVSAEQQPAGGAVKDSTFNQFKISKPTMPRNYEGFLFGDAQLQLILTQNGQKNIAAGDVVDYPHKIISKSVHKLGNVSPSNTQQPATGQVWQSIIYYDANCNGVVDVGEQQYDAALKSTALSTSILPDQKICLVQRVVSPSSAKSGDSLIAQFAVKHTPTVSGSSEKLSNKVQDMTTVGSAGLDLKKSVRKVASCPSTGIDTAAFTTENTASAGQFLEYEIAYANSSAKKLVEVVLKDAVPLGTSIKSMCTGDTCNLANSTAPLNWKIAGVLAPRATGTVRFCVEVQ